MYFGILGKPNRPKAVGTDVFLVIAIVFTTCSRLD